MQSIGKLVASQAAYYTDHLTHSVGEDTPVRRGPDAGPVDYYTGHSSPSRWMGGGLGRIGLEAGGPVAAETFAGLMGHVTPAGETMSVARSHGRVAAFDHTFSAPKSVSLLFAFGDDRVREAVVAAHRRAVAEAVAYMEEHCSQSRVGVRTRDPDGTPRFATRSAASEGYVAAAFDHFTSRANDPQVHTHVVVVNRVWAAGGWRAVDAKRAYAHAKAGGTVYQAVLRDRLTRTLGVGWQPVVDGAADIAGFTPELLAHFSTRRREILDAVDRYLARHGGDTHRRMLQAFTLETRQAKTYPAGEAAVARRMKDYGVAADTETHWQRRAADAPQDVIAAVRTLVAAGRPGHRPTTRQVEDAAQRTVAWVSDRHAVFTQRDLLAHVAALYPDGAAAAELADTTRRLLAAAQQAGQVLTVLPVIADRLTLPAGITLTPDEVDLAAGDRTGWIAQGPTVRFRALPGEARYTTRLQLERETRVLAAVAAPSPVAADPAILEGSIAARRLIDAQAAAVRHLTRLDGRLVAVVGPGGSGKTHSIAAYADAVAAAGHPVVGAATSAAAARQLGETLGPHRWSGTIAMLRHHTDTAGLPLRAGTVIVVDEASMVSTADLAWLVDRVEACDGKLILVGDPHQLPSVDSGGLFPRIVAAGHQVVDELARVNQRQQLDTDRQALDRLRRGEAAEAVRHYTEAGRLHLGGSGYATKAAMVDAWWADVAAHGLDRVRMLASRHDEVEMLNQLARVHMIEDGRLGGPALANRWGTEFRAGDRIVVRDNWYAHADLRNGQTGTVESVDPHTRTLRFRRDLDHQTIRLPKQYVDRDVHHAYAQTIHTAQGQTFQITHLYADPAVRAEHAYTALSRARAGTHLWLSDGTGPLGACTHIGQPHTEDRIGALVRRLTQTVIEAPAIDQGLPVRTATDHQLLTWRDELTRIIRHSPLTRDVDDQLVALDAALDEARQVAARLGTSGARAQLTHLETQRQQLADHQAHRQAWVEDNAPTLRRYTAIADEINHRIDARAHLYELDPPAELEAAIGTRPTDPTGANAWAAAVRRYAETTMAGEGPGDGLVASLRRQEDLTCAERIPVVAIGE